MGGFHPGRWIDDSLKGINNFGHKVFGLSSPDHPNGTGADIYVSSSTSTDMGYDLEGKNTALTMGEMAPGEYTEMYGNTTAYNEEKENNTNYVKDLLAPLLTGTATAYINNYYNRRYQNEQNEFNAEQARLNREWEEHMANTAHQREMADLLATGLNPVNTTTGGGGAATPGGSAASGATPPYMDANSIGNTALSLAETMKAINENKYISKEKKAQIANTVADTSLKSAQKSNTQENTNLIKEQAKQISIDNMTRDDLNKIEIILKSNESEKAKQEAISKALQNAYNKATGTTADQSTVERVASIAYTTLIKNPSQAIDKAIKYAIDKITKE